MASTGGASTAGQKPRVAATARNASAETTASARASPARTVPAGRCRMRVRGFFASTSRSAHRLNAMALVRAQTMLTTIAAIRKAVSGSCGTARERTTALAANGIAKTVCAKATSEPYVRTRARTLTKASPSRGGTWPLRAARPSAAGRARCARRTRTGRRLDLRRSQRAPAARRAPRAPRLPGQARGHPPT